MARRLSPARSGSDVRRPSVAGSFYPAEPGILAQLVDALLVEADRVAPAADRIERPIAGLLVPHAGLVYSGVVAAAGWRLVGTGAPGAPPPVVVILGTNHGAAWLDGVAAWDTGAWRTPLGDVQVDVELVASILDLGPPFDLDRAAHDGEHSIEVQLPFLQAGAPTPRIVPLSVAAGTGERAIAAGARLGALLVRRRDDGSPIILAISSDMAHYPPSTECARVTGELLPAIARVDPVELADRERAVTEGGMPALLCGMCGIQPAVLGLAALRAMGATHGTPLSAATSADAGGPANRTVGYLAVAFTDGRG
jgi:AmmeMemoRadiSam system protein B